MFPARRRQQKRWMSLPKLGLNRRLTSAFLTLFCPFRPHSEEARRHVVSFLWGGPWDEEARAASANSQQRAEALRSTACEERNPTNNHSSQLGGRSPSSRPESMPRIPTFFWMTAPWFCLEELLAASTGCCPGGSADQDGLPIAHPVYLGKPSTVSHGNWI